MEKITPTGIKRKKLYRGFSTYNYEVNKTHRVYDVDCVKIDLLNHLYTRKGTRPMMPNFGTRIPELVMEQLDDEMIDALEEDVRQVIAFDPRVELFDDASLIVQSYPDRQTVIIAAKLRYIELNYVDTLTLNLEFGG